MSVMATRPVILCRSATFLIADPSGDILGADQGFYHLDRRLLHRHRLTFGGKRPTPLSGRAIEADQAQFFLVAPKIAGLDRGAIVVERRVRLFDGVFDEEIALHNYTSRDACVPLELLLGGDFSHVFGVKRRMLGERAGDGTGGTEMTRRAAGAFCLAAPKGTSGLRVLLQFDHPATAADTDTGRLHFALTVPAEGTAALHLHCDGRGTAARATQAPGPIRGLEPPPVVRARGELGTALMQAYDRSMRDLYALAIRGRTIGLTEGDESVAYAAGIPWYIALFGRDALLTSHMTMHYAPAFAAGSLRALSRLQGTRHDVETAEEPGKILHEFRPLLVPDDRRTIPRFPYYGSVDATPLFLVALEELERVTGSPDLTDELWPSAQAALSWMDGAGDQDRDGYLEYQRIGLQGLRNQGWKDSWDAIHFRDKRLAQAPIALVEVQGYQYAARRAMERLLMRRGEHALARRESQSAEELRRNFDRDFWMDERGFYALGLDRRKRQIDVLSSNGAQVLFTGIADPKRAQTVAQSVLREPLWGGLGVRTLAVGEGRYNPVSYHNGSVWPHDNALIAEGLARIGRPDGAMHIAEAMLRASRQRADRRLPELYAGFSTSESQEPVPYPSACPVQAWSAAAVPHLLTLMLGLTVEGGRASVLASLPEGIDEIEVEGLWVLGERASVRISRDRMGRAVARVGGSPALQLRVRRGVTR